MTDPQNGTKQSETTYTYNLQGRMATASVDLDNDGNVDHYSEYEYDDSGIRVAQTEQVDANDDGDLNDEAEGDKNTRTDYLVDHRNHTGYAQVLEEMLDPDGDGNAASQLAKSYTIGHDILSEATAANQIHNLLKDGHGSTRQLVNATGTIVRSDTPQVFAYDAYGNPHGFTLAQAHTTHLYTGEQTDQLTGLQYLRARYYNPATGTFNQLDPFSGNLSDPQSLHKYLYTHGDPVNGVDPTGEFLMGSTLLAVGLALNNMAAEAMTGSLIISFLNTGGKAAYSLYQAGLMCIADGEFEAGFALYDAGTRMFGLTLDVIETVDAGIGGIQIGSLLTTAAIKLLDAAPRLAQDSLDFFSSVNRPPDGLKLPEPPPGFLDATVYDIDDIRMIMKNPTNNQQVGLGPFHRPPFPKPKDSIRYTWQGHKNGAWAEEYLARLVHYQPDEVVIRWGDKIGTHGADIISVNPTTGEVTLWDAKYRTNDTTIGNSPTFTNGRRRENAINEAITTLEEGKTGLPAEIRDRAIQNLEAGRVKTRTVGFGPGAAGQESSISYSP